MSKFTAGLRLEQRTETEGRVKMAIKSPTVFKIQTHYEKESLLHSKTAAWPYYFEVLYAAKFSQTVVSALFNIQQS